MRKLTAIGIIVLFVVGLIPLLWLHPGFIISNGDNIPPSLNAAKTFSSSANMWSSDYFGYASPNPAYFLDTCFAAFLGILGLSAGLIQIIIQILLYMGAGFSMYLFSKTIYPEHKIAPFFAAFFYMFNFFVLDSRFNLGFAWLYTFLPLLLALFVKIVNATYRQDKKSANIGIIFFGLVSVVALSVASVNPANIALFLVALSVFAVYFLIKHRKNLLPFLFAVGKITAVTIPINIWWMFPMLNTFIFSPVGLNSQVNVASWSWTHARSSFLNLFWFNGTWGWLPEYVPFIDYYSNQVVVVLTFVPFLAAGAALFFKSKRSRFNAYIMGCVLFFLFLAKGVHDPFGDLLLYNISLMSMFREPASKFTLLIIPFLALLIGYSAESISNIKLNIRSNRLKSIKVFILLFLAVSFVISSFPLLNIKAVSVFEPDSSYIQIPQYWYQATNWINSQPGDGQVLLTPLNDYYQMPYTWGYYGSDQLLERLFEKPIVSTAALDGYVTNPDTAADLKQIRASVRFNQTAEFKALLGLLNIKYIVQRNDVKSDFSSSVQPNDVQNDTIPRDLKSPSEMQSFFADQPYLKLVKAPPGQDFGKLDIYEYTEAKPSLYAILPSTLQKADVHINTYSILDKMWNFSSKDDVNKWDEVNKNSTDLNQPQISQINGQQLEASMSSLKTGWIKVNSPIINVTEIESSYLINAIGTGVNTRRVDVKIAEYSKDMTPLTSSTIAMFYGRFDSNVSFTVDNYRFVPENSSIEFFRVEFWNYVNSTKNSESSLLLGNVGVNGSVSTLDMTGLQYLNWGSLENPNAEVLQVQNISPEKTIVKVNATQPFILATTQTLDRFWVAYVNNQKVSPSPVYLGLKGFLINETGQFDVTIVYQPQDWFNYCLTISSVTVLLLCIGLVYLNRKTIKASIKKPSRQS
jgi:hypothetical protein